VRREHSPQFCPKAIVLYDRLYADYAVMAFHHARGVDFVIRAPSSHTFKEVEAFTLSPEEDRIVTLNGLAPVQWTVYPAAW